MRKIQSAAEIEADKKKKGRMLSVFMLIILVGSLLGYAIGFRQDDSSSNSNTGNSQVNGNTYRYGDIDLYFTHTKSNVSDVSVDTFLTINNYYGKKVYLSSNNSAVKNEIISTLGNFVSIQEACYGKCDSDLPEKTCSDNMIVWQNSKENKVYQKDNCVFIDGDLKAADAYLYKIFGL